MNMLITSLIYYAIIFLTSCNMHYPSKNEDTKLFKDAISYNDTKVYDLSMVALIGDPERYNGKRVRIIGYLNLEFEGNILYFHKEDYDAAMSKNGLWIDISKRQSKYSKFSKRYVIVEATFGAHNLGHMSSCSGALTNITRLDLWHQTH